jgi:hypothetical protein
VSLREDKAGRYVAFCGKLKESTTFAKQKRGAHVVQTQIESTCPSRERLAECTGLVGASR